MNDLDRHGSQPPRDGEDDPLEPVAFASSEFAARTKAAVLENEGIPAVVFTAERAWTGGISLRPGNTSVPVFVRRSDIDRAKAVLAAAIADSVDLDWEKVDVGEPDQPLPAGRSSMLLAVRLVAVACVILCGVVTVLLLIGSLVAIIIDALT